MSAAMPHLATKYTNEQREALACTYVDSGVRPAGAVADMARRGELVLRGERLDAFETNENTVRHEVLKLRKRRSTAIARGTGGASPRDSIENFRQRLGVVIDRKLHDLELMSPKRVEPAQLQGMARAVKEFAALPGPDDPRPVPPGQKMPGTQQTNGSRIGGGLAGEIVAAARVSTREPTAPETSSPSTSGVDAPQRTADEGQSGEQSDASGEPGSWASEQVSALLGAERSE